MEITIADVIALGAAAAAWLAVILQWRSASENQRDVTGRLDVLRDLIDRINSERDTRERQMRERLLTEIQLKATDMNAAIGWMGATNDVSIVKQLLLWNQVAGLYLAHNQDRQGALLEYASVVADTISCIGAANGMHLIARKGPHNEDLDAQLRQLAKVSSDAFARVTTKSQEFCRRLEEAGHIRFGEKGEFDKNLHPFHYQLQPVKEVNEEYEQLLRRLAAEISKNGAQTE